MALNRSTVREGSVNVTDDVTESGPDAVFYIAVKYVFPVIIIVGSVGNGLSFLVLVRKRLRGNSLYFYLMVLTLADTLVLYVSCLKTWVRTISGFELLHVSDASCKITMFILLLSMHMSAWLVVLVTFDRFVSVWFPFRAATICTTRRARIITFTLLLLIVAFDLHVFWTIGISTDADDGVTYCKADPDIPFMQQPFEYLKLASYCFIPFAAVFALNLGIIVKLTRGSKLLRQEASLATASVRRGTPSRGRAGSHHQAANPRQQRVVYMLLTMSLSWLVLTAPYAVFSILINAARGLVSHNSFHLLWVVAFILLYLNHSINFYLYCISGERFREEFVEMMCEYVDRCRCRHSNQQKRKYSRTMTMSHV